MLERGKNERGVIEMVDTESLVPTEHLFRQVWMRRCVLNGCIMVSRSRCTSRIKGGGASARWYYSSWCCSNTWMGKTFDRRYVVRLRAARRKMQAKDTRCVS